jgi:twinkle protein
VAELPESDDVGGEYHFEYISRRGISKEAHEFYGVKAKVNSKSGEPVSVEYPHKNGAQVRSCSVKRFHSVGNMSTPGCFGADRFPAGSAKAITITEGSDDMMAVRDMMGNYPVISLRSASSAQADCRADYDLINSFDKIILCLDNDEPGKKAAHEIASIFGFKKVFNLPCAPYKDAQEWLEKGDKAAFRSSWFNADRFLPEGIISGIKQVKTIFHNRKHYKRWPTPFESLNYMLGGGLEVHRAYLVSGLTGIGKTEFFRACQHKWYTDKDSGPIGVLHFEEPIDETIERAVSYALKTNVRDPETHVTEDQILEKWEEIAREDGRVNFVQHFGSEDPDVILSKVRFLVAACGCEQVYLDNITVLGTGRVQEDERKELDYLSTQLEMLVKELPFSLVFISHENEQEGTRGSANINKVVDVWLNLKRNVKADNDYERTLLYLYLNKNRQASRTGPAGIAQYDLSTGMLTEVNKELPT